MEKVKAKKHLGQHFLKDESIAKGIADTLNLEGYNDVLEIGPGMGVLTKYLLEKPINTYVIEIDSESVEYLDVNYPKLHGKIISKDFLKYNINEVFEGKQFAIIGNFPYNISSQIVFKIIENTSLIERWVGMFQLEMGIRLVALPKDKKDYGILSVLVPFYYSVETIMTLPPSAFNPPPKVNSIVVKATRRNHEFRADPALIKHVVKTAFGQRRKTLSNSLSQIIPKEVFKTHPFSTLRPENLTHLEFEELCVFIAVNVIN